MLRAKWKFDAWKLWTTVAVSAALLELPFPLAGPLPAWRSVFAWFALTPLLWALLGVTGAEEPRPPRWSFLLGYFCGTLWFAGNCYWVRDTMQHYGDLPVGVPTLLLVGFSLYLGLYMGCFGLGVALVRRATGSTRLTLAAVPFLWVAMELAAARVTGFPWDQLGMTQVDNGLLTQLAPWTGVYGISFVVMAANALLAGSLVLDPHSQRRAWGAAGVVLLAAGVTGLTLASPQPAPTASAVLVQPNLDVADDNLWQAPGEWEQHIANFQRLANQPCQSYTAGIPETGAPQETRLCQPGASHPDLVVWPESPAPFFESEPRLQGAMKDVAASAQAPLVVGGVGMEISPEDHLYHGYNSALVFAANGASVGRYDKIHLVPFGEYVPFKQLLFFARSLTGRVGDTERGVERKVFRLGSSNGQAHRYGVFICYESVFGDEVRQFAQLGAEVLVNVSDDGWYGNTSAPWQHLNMARMRAIENRRWILRDTNSGVTAVIDPYGRVRQSIARHQTRALSARYGFRDEMTFYTAHGDLFAWACAILAIGVVGWSLRVCLRRYLHPKVRS
jgi:apolipoprotein N-acyltransferase